MTRKASIERMSRGITLVFLFLVVEIVVSVVIFHVQEGQTVVDAFYFTISTLTTVGYGDYNLHDSESWVKIYGTFLMVSGAASVAVVFAFVSDFLIQLRFDKLFRNEGAIVKNHVVVCGEAQLGYRIVTILREYGEDVVYVVRSDEDPFVEKLKAAGAIVQFGDASISETLEKARLVDAKSLIVATNEDLKNLSIAVNARSLKEDCQVVLRIFDDTLTDKLESAFNIHTAYSSTAISAPSFALAALDPQKSIVNSFSVRGEEFVTITLHIREGSELHNTPFEPIFDELSAHLIGAESDLVADGRLVLDRELVIVLPFANLKRLQAMNA